MRLLGAVLAGGQSRRFGSDKALAEWRGRPLIDHVTAALAQYVAQVAICGRDLPDRPRPGLGPLGGLNAALRFAADQGFERVVSVPCDTPVLSPRLLSALAAANGPAAVVAALPVIGNWPATLGPRLDEWLAQGEDRSMRGWARAIGAVPISITPGNVPLNVNRPADLAELDDHIDSGLARDTFDRREV